MHISFYKRYDEKLKIPPLSIIITIFIYFFKSSDLFFFVLVSFKKIVRRKTAVNRNGSVSSHFRTLARLIRNDPSDIKRSCSRFVKLHNTSIISFRYNVTAIAFTSNYPNDNRIPQY